MDATTTIEKADQLWASLVEEYKFLKDKSEVHEKRRQLKRKEIIISAFGRHNCGKSTLLNTLLGNSCLPVSVKNETGIEVKIKHDGHVHSGYCVKNCTGPCPQLVLEVSDGSKDEYVVARGSGDICEKLEAENQQSRTSVHTGVKNGQDVRKLYVLHAHIPILEEAHHSGWTLALVDTPGFGEANVEHVTSHADMLFSTSTAYLYMMDSSNLEDAVDAANIRQLYQYDKELFNDGRFVVAISKYDLYLSAQSLNQQRNRRTQRRDTHVKEHSPQQTTKSFIATSIGIEPPPDIAIPVSAEWAELAQYLRQDPTDADIQKARGILALYPDAQPQGQGEVEISPPTLVASLQRISGIPDLEERLRTIIARCIHIWQTSLVKAYTSYLQEAKEVLTCNHQQRMEEKDSFQSMLELHKRYQNEKARLCSRAFEEKDTKTEFQLMLEEKYAEFDVKAAERLLHGWINEMVNRFSDMTKMQVEHGEKPFLQRDYEAAMKKFIEEEVVPTLSREQENMKLDGVAAAFRDSLDDMDKLDREIEDIAESIVPSGWSPENDLLRKDRDKKSEKGIISDHVLQMKQLTLKDLQRRTNAPPLSIGRIQRFFDRVKRLFGMAVAPDEERPYRKWGKEMNDAMLSLKDDLVSEVDTYVTGSLQRWIIYEVLSPAYGNRVKNRAMALTETYDRVINEEKARLETAFELCKSDMSSLDENIKKINAVLESLTV